MKKDEIMEAISNINISTARGRAELYGREIKMDPQRNEMDAAAINRASGYIEMAREISNQIQCNRHGISKSELEKAELIREQLQDAARTAYESLIERI